MIQRTSEPWSTAELHQYSIENEHDINEFEGLSCKYNRTLTFVMLGSIYYETFVKNLGLSKNLTKTESAVIIVDNQSDSVYELKRDVSSKSLTSFIKDFHPGRLKRRRRNLNKHKSRLKEMRNVNIHLPEKLRMTGG